MNDNGMERTRLLVGDHGVERLRRARVLVLGLGGVGAFAAEFLVRAGVGALKLVDGDVVSDSNRNRQLIALVSTLGEAKAEVLRRRLLDIAPDVQIEAVNRFIEPEDIPELLFGDFDFVVDAIDSVRTKAALIAYCCERALPLVSSMGAGGRVDMERIKLARLSKTHDCGLARAVRRRLREIGSPADPPAVFSPELARGGLCVSDSRPGTISYLPAAFGARCAQAAIEHLLEK